MVISAQAVDRSQLIRLPTHAGDPPAVLEEVADLLAVYSARIERDVDKIAAQCRSEDLAAAAAAYLAEIGSNIPDKTIRAAVKRCARAKFQIRGYSTEAGAWAQRHQ